MRAGLADSAGILSVGKFLGRVSLQNGVARGELRAEFPGDNRSTYCGSACAVSGDHLGHYSNEFSPPCRRLLHTEGADVIRGVSISIHSHTFYMSTLQICYAAELEHAGTGAASTM
jgi:hypothetical protein